jgi:hypothetical protein
MSFPSFDDLSSFTSDMGSQLQQFVSYLFGWLSKEHNDDGTHANLTATTITVANATSNTQGLVGNVVGNLVPSKNATYTLGQAQTVAHTGLYALAWKELFLSNTFHLGSVSSGGVNPVITALTEDTVTSLTRTTTINGAIGGTHSWSVVSPTSATLVQFGGSCLVGGSLATDVGVTFPGRVRVENVFGADAGLYERSRSTKLGEWQNVAFSAGNFTANGAMTWTVTSGEQITYSYTLVGNTMFLNVYLDSTTVGGTPNSLLFVAIPGGFIAARKAQAGSIAFDNGTGVTTFTRVQAGGATVEIGKLDGTNWTASTTNTFIRVMITFEVQ